KACIGKGMKRARLSSCIIFFEACSAFIHVTTCRLTESPVDPLHRRLRRLCCLHRRSDSYRVERSSSRAGLGPAVDQRLLTAHCKSLITVNPRDRSHRHTSRSSL